MHGADAITVAPMVGVSVLVNGGDPANSDTLEVNGTTAANDITVSPTGRDSGTVQVDTLGLVTFNTVEALTVNGLGGDDTLEYRTPAGRDLIQYQPGSPLGDGQINASRVFGSAYVPISHMNFGFLGTITFADAANIRSDNLTYLATNLDDSIQVNANGMIRLSQWHKHIGCFGRFQSGNRWVGTGWGPRQRSLQHQRWPTLLVDSRRRWSRGRQPPEHRLAIWFTGNQFRAKHNSWLWKRHSVFRHRSDRRIREQQTRRISRYDRRRCDADHGAE